MSTVSVASAPCPVVVLDADGHIAELNAAAGALLPTARVGRPLSSPTWLAAGDRARPVPLSGTVGDRSFSAHPSVAADGRTVWWLMEETAYRSAVGELEAERARTRFLTEASGALLASLNLERCMEVTARLATEHLADAALVIAPSVARTLPVVACDQRGELTRSTVSEAPYSVPGLAEALRGFPPVPSRWIDPATAPDWLIPAGFGEVGSLVITPLPGLGVPAGALILLRRAQQDAFSKAEESLAGVFAARAGAAMSAARLYAEQNSISDTLMRELLPPTLRQTEGVEFAGGYRASKDTERMGGQPHERGRRARRHRHQRPGHRRPVGPASGEQPGPDHGRLRGPGVARPARAPGVRDAAAARLAGGLPRRAGPHRPSDQPHPPHRTGRGVPVQLAAHPAASRAQRDHRRPGRRHPGHGRWSRLRCRRPLRPPAGRRRLGARRQRGGGPARDSMGLSILLEIHRSAGRDGIAFHLGGVGPALLRLLELTGTYEYLTSPQRSGTSAGSRYGRT
ncbi:hypothetical protein HDC93_002125 [Streptomyces sp. AK010]|nr:hypothetical protein [Streptomyces sp. AK010]